MDEYLQKQSSMLKRIWAGAKKHKVKSIIGLVVLLIIGGALAQGKPETEEAQAILKQVEVLNVDTLVSDGGSVPVVGTLQANEQLDLRPQIGGQVSRVLVDLDQEVRAGQVLVELNHADLDAQVAQASASVQSALASLAKMRSGDRVEDVEIARQNLAQAEQQLEDMRNGGRAEEVAQAKLNVELAKSAVDDAYANHRNTVDQNQNNKSSNLENAVLAITSAQFLEDGILEQDLASIYNSNNDYRPFPIIKDKALESEVIFARRNVDTRLNNWRRDTETLSSTNQNQVLTALDNAKAELTVFLDFLDLTGDALDDANPSLSFDQSQIASSIATVNAARSSVKAQIDLMVSTRQSVLNQDITNKKALDAAQTQINQAETSYENAKEQLQIVQKGATPEQLAIQESVVRQAEQRLLISQNGARPEDLRLQEASLAQARASLALAVANRNKAIIKAPIDGKVTYLPVEISDIVGSSSIVVSLANQGGLQVETFITEDERSFVEIGNTVLINETYEGLVQEIAPALDPINKKIEVTITVTSEETSLTLGETVRLEIQKVSPDQSILKVPLSTVKLQATGATVFLVNEEGLLQSQSVEIGDVTANKIEIISPLPEGSRIVKDARGLKDGQEVIINQ